MDKIDKPIPVCTSLYIEGYIDLTYLKQDEFINYYAISNKINIKNIYDSLYKLRDYINTNMKFMINYLINHSRHIYLDEILFMILATKISTEYIRSYNIYSLYETPSGTSANFLGDLIPTLSNTELCRDSETPSIEHIRKCPVCFRKHGIPNLKGKEYDNIWHPFKNSSRDHFNYVVCHELHKKLDPLVKHVVENYFRYSVHIKKSDNIKVIFDD